MLCGECFRCRAVRTHAVLTRTAGSLFLVGILKPSTCFLVSNYLEQADMTLTPRVEQRAGHRDQICWWCHADAVF